MSPDPQFESRPGIGARLKEARRRLGMDVKEAEERTKIRARYLRALEAEDWELLPGAAYVRGFLRAYGQVLGLDGELLADEFRRHHEEPSNGHGIEPPPRRRAGGRSPGGGPSWGLWALGALVALIALLILIGLLGGSGDGSGSGTAGKRDEGAAGKRAERERKSGRSDPGERGLGPADLRVEALETVRVCLVGGRRDALIDSQMMIAGTRESFTDERRYRLDLEGGGRVKVAIAGARKTLDAPGDASFELDRGGIRPVAYAGAGCP